jgi:hypothetical protein
MAAADSAVVVLEAEGITVGVDLAGAVSEVAVTAVVAASTATVEVATAAVVSLAVEISAAADSVAET